MSDQEQIVKEADFDTMLENVLDEAPPEEVIRIVTPWRRAMNQILIGLALNSLTLNFWLLQYILPTIGVLLLLLGFRTLRRENPWFRKCWYITLVRAGIFLPTLGLNATIYCNEIYNSGIGKVWTVLNVAIIFAQIFCLWRGLRMIQEKAGLPAHTGSAVALMVWYGVVCLLAVIMPQTSLISGILVVAAYIFIIRCLYRLSQELEEAGYAVETAPVRMPDWAVVSGTLAVLTVGMICGYLFGGSYRMNWRTLAAADAQESEYAERIEKVRAELLELGFPEYVLNDLTEEDLLACEGAKRLVKNTRVQPANDGRWVTENRGNHLYTDLVYDVKELRITGVAVELPGEREQWKLFHHFLWEVDPGFYGTESMQFWPTDRLSGWSLAGDFTGQVLYDRDGVTYVSDYHSLGKESYVSNGFFWEQSDRTDVFATFSFPEKGENQRGYVSYAALEMQDGYIVDSWINYTHQKSWAQYPALTAKEFRKKETFLNDRAFITIQDALQYHPTENDVRLLFD